MRPCAGSSITDRRSAPACGGSTGGRERLLTEIGDVKTTRDTGMMAPATDPRYRRLGLAAGYVGVWAVLWYVSGALNLATGISLWHPPAGLTFAILLECGLRALPLPVVASLLAGLSLWSWDLWPYYLAVNLLTPLGYAATAGAMRRCWLGRGGQDPWRFNDARQVAAFLAAAAIGSLSAALVGTLLLKAAGVLSPQTPLFLAVLGWWTGDFVGIATFAPLLLIFVAPPARRFGEGEPPRPLRCLRSVDPSLTRVILAQSLLSILLLAGLFWAPYHLWHAQPNPFMTLLMLPILVWIVATHGIRGAVAAVFLYELGIVTMVLLFGSADLALQYQIVMATVAASGLLTGAVSHERLNSTALFRDLAEISNDLLWEFDAVGHLRELRGKFAKSAKPRHIRFGMSWQDLVVSQEQDTDLAALRTAIRQRQPFQQLELRVRLPGQEHSIWTRNSGLPLFDEEGEFLGYRGATVDISDHKQAEALHKKAEALLRNYDRTLEAKVEAKVEERTRQLAEVSLRNWRLANYDALTSLPNRNLLFEHLRKGLQQARRRWRLLAILLVDLDGFKQVNDTFGHDAGDELLRQVAIRLQQCVRATDTAARLGGDEFTVVLPDLEGPDAAAAVAQKIIARLAEPVPLGSASATVTASVGIALYRPELPANIDLAMNLLRQADAAMYAAKRAGKNAWRFADQLGLG